MEEIKTKYYIYVDKDEKEHTIRPCIIDEVEEVIRLYNKIDTDIMFKNLPQPMLKYDKDGKAILDKQGNLVLQIDRKTKEPKLDYTRFDAMKKLLEKALDEDYDDLKKWVDVENSIDIIDKYVGIYKLKKKMEQMITEKMAVQS